MALGAPGWTRWFVGFFCLIMAAFAVLVESILGSKGFSFSLGLVAFHAKLAGGLPFLPGVVAFQAIDLQSFRMFRMGKLHLPISRVEFDHILRKTTTDQ